MDWSTRRQLTILLGILVLVMSVILVIFWRVALVERPTCSDGLKNGEEAGIDCGGTCPLLCQEETVDPVIRWSRAVPSVAGSYHLIAYLENTNKTATMVAAPYRFSVFGAGVGQQAEFGGEFTVPPGQRSVVFMPKVAIDFEPEQTFFEFLKPPVWQRSDISIVNQIVVDGVSFGFDTLVPTLEATLRNTTFEDVDRVAVIALGYDRSQNVVLASRTYVDNLPATSEAPLRFTWPESVGSVDPDRFEFVIMLE